MKRVIIVQARMTSTRLPGKILMPIMGRPMLAHQIRRMKACQQADEIVIATTVNATDDPVVALAESEGVRWYRGSEDDVLGRYTGAAREARADVVVRVTADCPLIDPAVTDQVISELSRTQHPSDYAANILKRTYPRGLDTEALYRDVLERVNRLASSNSAREHVTHFVLREHPELFICRSVHDEQDNSDLRWTVDVPEDLDLVRRVYEAMNLDQCLAGFREVLAFMRSHPALMSINVHVEQKTYQ